MDWRAIKEYLEPGSLLDCRGGGYSPFRRLAYRFNRVGGVKMLGIVRLKRSIPQMAESGDVFPVNGPCGHDVSLLLRVPENPIAFNPVPGGCELRVASEGVI